MIKIVGLKVIYPQAMIKIVWLKFVYPQAMIKIVGLKVISHESIIDECHRLRANAIRSYSNVLTSIK